MFDFNLDFSGEAKTLKDAPTELTDEIKSFRQKNKEFAATNEHETYLIISFSCKKDKEIFCDEVGITEHTLVDGYELARALKVEPKKPSFKLPKPITAKK
jgi:hypothetical protein